MNSLVEAQVSKVKGSVKILTFIKKKKKKKKKKNTHSQDRSNLRKVVFTKVISLSHDYNDSRPIYESRPRK